MKKKYSICVIGLGYVGLPLFFSFNEKKFKVIGFDHNKKLINDLKKNKSHIEDISKDDFLLLDKKNILFTSNYKEIAKADVIIICVPTPIHDDKTPDNSYLNSVANILSKIDLKGKIIINESTTYPGATKEIFGTLLLKQKLIIGKNCYLAFSPERLQIQV